MADVELESTYNDVVDFNSTDFTQNDLVTTFHYIVNEYKRLFQSFEEVKADKINLTDKDTEYI